MNLILRIWGQAGPDARGGFQTYEARGVSGEMSFLEFLDALNEQLIANGEEPVAFDHDCREGICGSCGVMTARRTDRSGGPPRASCTCATPGTARSW